MEVFHLKSGVKSVQKNASILLLKIEKCTP